MITHPQRICSISAAWPCNAWERVPGRKTINQIQRWILKDPLIFCGNSERLLASDRARCCYCSQRNVRSTESSWWDSGSSPGCWWGSGVDHWCEGDGEQNGVGGRGGGFAHEGSWCCECKMMDGCVWRVSFCALSTFFNFIQYYWGLQEADLIPLRAPLWTASSARSLHLLHTSEVLLQVLGSRWMRFSSAKSLQSLMKSFNLIRGAMTLRLYWIWICINSWIGIKLLIQHMNQN